MAFNYSLSPTSSTNTNNTGNTSQQQPGDRIPIDPLVFEFATITVKFLFPVIIIIGSVGNGLSFLVLLRKRLRGNSLYFYLMVLTLADTLVLYVSCLKTWVRTISGFELLHVSDASCKITMFILLLSMHMAAWLVVLVTFDRFVSVWFPFRAATICTSRRARTITFVLLIVIVLYNLHVYWTLGLHLKAPSTHLRCISQPNDPFMQEPFEYMKLASYCFIPFLTVFVLNLGIIFKITHGSSVLRRTETSVTIGSGSRQLSRQSSVKYGTTLRASRQQRVIYMLLTLSFSWLILTAPYAIISVIITAAPDMMSRNTRILGKTIAFLLLYLNHSINFYLYCITGKKFRQEFTDLFWVYVDRWRRRGSGRRKSIRTAQTPLIINLIPDVKGRGCRALTGSKAGSGTGSGAESRGMGSDSTQPREGNRSSPF